MNTTTIAMADPTNIFGTGESMVVTFGSVTDPAVTGLTHATDTVSAAPATFSTADYTIEPLSFRAGDAQVTAYLSDDTTATDQTGQTGAEGGRVGQHPAGTSGTTLDPITGKPAANTTTTGTVQVQLGAGAIVIGIVVATYFMIKHKKWSWGPVLTGVAIGTVSAGAGAGSLMIIPSTLANSLITAFGNALSGIA